MPPGTPTRYHELPAELVPLAGYPAVPKSGEHKGLKRLWRIIDPSTVLKWRQPAASNTRRPAVDTSASGATAGAGLPHDPTPPEGATAARDAAQLLPAPLDNGGSRGHSLCPPAEVEPSRARGSPHGAGALLWACGHTETLCT